MLFIITISIQIVQLNKCIQYSKYTIQQPLIKPSQTNLLLISIQKQKSIFTRMLKQPQVKSQQPSSKHPSQQQQQQHIQVCTQQINKLNHILTKDSMNNSSTNNKVNHDDNLITVKPIQEQQLEKIHKQAYNEQEQSLELDSQKSCDDLCVQSKIKRLMHAVKSHIYMKTLLQSEVQTKVDIFSADKHIKPKMISKLLGWIQKLCFQTFNFSYETYQICVKILKQYLSMSNQPSNQLQMLGCIVLHMASKLSEHTIISIDSYIECSMKLFTRQQFLIKQCQIFQLIDCYVPCPIYYSISSLIQYQILKQYVLTNRQMQVLDIGLKLVLREIQIQEEVRDFVQGVNVVVAIWKYICQNKDKLEILKQDQIKCFITKEMLIQMMKGDIQ